MSKTRQHKNQNKEISLLSDYFNVEVYKQHQMKDLKVLLGKRNTRVNDLAGLTPEQCVTQERDKSINKQLPIS